MPPACTSLTSRRSFGIALSVLVLASAGAGQAAAPPRKIGFGVKVMTDGLLSQTISRIEVTKVSPGSQAQAAGVAVGDEVVKVDDIVVPGANALKLKAHMDFQPGVPKKIGFKHPNGVVYVATFTRAADPKGK